MAYSRLLLLLIGAILSVRARPADFWCNRQARKNMENVIEGLSADVATCVGADTLPSPVQLPCVLVHATEWANKTLQQKRAEVLEALRVFREGVRAAKSQSTSECQTSVLERLERHIANYLAIVAGLHIRDGSTTPSPPAGQTCSSMSSTSKLLKNYGNLLKGKLDRLAVDLRDHAMDQGDHAVDLRDHAVDQGDHAVDQGDHAVDQGDHAVDQGDHAVDLRDHAVDQGDHAVDQGDHAVDLRDHAVDQGDHAVDQGDHVSNVEQGTTATEERCS
ncbi:thrombopoietin [Clinocottus analis]|uniref:thrombopoietin n=1 Tax=Clinocottus analis TaxID=304258 RepID=UPI0035BFDCC1